jgi:translation initiation factor 2A
MCPFSNICLIGGFGNLAGEIDFWNLSEQKELGKTKSYCSVGIEWAPDGLHLMTSVLYDRVKVDNEVKIFRADGVQVGYLSFKDSELYDAQWQPYPKGTFKVPSYKFEKILGEEDGKKQAPKKMLKTPGGENNAF